jgi:hypothetical protein
MRTTGLEAIVLHHIAYNLYQPGNGRRPETFGDTSAIWSNAITDSNSLETVRSKSLPGVVTSLSRKGLVQSDGECVSLTETGFEIWQKLPPPRTVR